MDKGKMVKLLRQRTAEARTRLAKGSFGWDKVVKAIDEAILHGRDFVLIEPSEAVDLSREKDAVATFMRLRGEHCEAEWIASQKYTGINSQAMALRVSWAEDRKTKAAPAPGAARLEGERVNEVDLS